MVAVGSVATAPPPMCGQSGIIPPSLAAALATSAFVDGLGRDGRKDVSGAAEELTEPNSMAATDRLIVRRIKRR